MAIHTITKEGNIIRITHKRTVTTIDNQQVEIISGTEEVDVDSINSQIERCNAQKASLDNEIAKYQQALTDLNLQLVDGVVVDKVVEEII